MSRPRVVMLSPVNFLRNYAGFQYLADALHQRGYRVEVYAAIPRPMVPEARLLPYPVFSCYQGFAGHIPRLRHLIFQKRIRLAMGGDCTAVIVNFTRPPGYFSEAVLFKKKHPDRLLVQYMPELWLPEEADEVPVAARLDYSRQRNAADLIIDVEPHRAELRRDRLGVDRPFEVIPNTLPRSVIPKPALPGKLFEIAGIRPPSGRRVVLFTGPIYQGSLDEIVSVARAESSGALLVWLCNSPDHAIAEARREISIRLGDDRIHICPGVPRVTLLSVLHQADAGLILYSYRAVPTMNQFYAAPTKLYEYLAAGLPVVSYPNPSIRDLVNRFDLGICAEQDHPESLGKAIGQLFDRPDFGDLRKHVRHVFYEELCYEKSASKALARVYSLIEDAGERSLRPGTSKMISHE